MKKRKISTILLSGIMSIMLLVSCGTSSSSGDSSTGSTENTVSDNSKLTVGMVVSEAGLGDKSFNDIAYTGLTKVKEDYGIDLKLLEAKQDSELEPYVDKISQTSDIVVGVGYKLKDAIQNSSSKNSNVNYILIDDEVTADNVYNLRFKEEEGSFLAGVLAGLVTETNKVGFIGGIDSPLIRKFESGFIAGVKSVNPEAGKLLEDGVTSRYSGSFSDVSKGYEIGKSLFNDGVDIIYHAAASVGIGMFRAAQETGNLGIGVDQDQAVVLPEYSDVILTSVVKNIDTSIYSILEGFIKNGFTSGTAHLGLKENGVSLAETKNEKVTKEILDKVEEFKNKIINGDIVVPTTIEELKNFNN